MRFTMSVAGVPAWLRSALLPVPAAASAKASSYGGGPIEGNPARGIPAPKPAAIPETAAGWRWNQGSYVSPDIRFPSIYYVAKQNRPPVRLRSNNPKPIPAGNYRNMPKVSQRGRRMGGQSQIVQPAALQTWPSWKPGAR